MELLNIAVRNIRRNERRSRLTIITIVIGVAILMNMQGIYRGLTTTIYGHMMAMDTAQVQIENATYRVDARRLPLDKTIDNPAALASMIRNLPGVKAVSERIDASFEITNGKEGVRVQARGVSHDEARVTDLGKSIVEGRLFAPGEPGLVIGKGMATKLGLKIGDAAWFTALDRHSVRNLESAPIVGIFEFGFPLLDDYMIYLDIDQARQFLDLGKVATRLVVRGVDPIASASLTKEIAAAVAKNGSATQENGKILTVYEWKTFAENLVSTIETRLQLLLSILVVLFSLIIAGIFNTMAMNVQERWREIGTLRAIGIRRAGLERIFLLEGSIMGIMGCIIAAVPATAVGLWLGVWGIDISGIMPRDIPIPFGSVLHASYSVIDALRAIIAGVGAALLGSWFPARRAARLPIAEAIAAVR
ncbi:MAG TPA: ABC transporter permease [Rectinemataceae bacterium]|nr:ABC transporter permease [Rectinemataceae bacterium]